MPDLNKNTFNLGITTSASEENLFAKKKSQRDNKSENENIMDMGTLKMSSVVEV